MPQTIETFKVLEVLDLVLTIDEHGIANTVSNDRVTPVGFNIVTSCFKAKIEDVPPQTRTKTDETYPTSPRL